MSLRLSKDGINLLKCMKANKGFWRFYSFEDRDDIEELESAGAISINRASKRGKLTAKGWELAYIIQTLEDMVNE